MSFKGSHNKPTRSDSPHGKNVHHKHGNGTGQRVTGRSDLWNHYPARLLRSGDRVQSAAANSRTHQLITPPTHFHRTVRRLVVSGPGSGPDTRQHVATPGTWRHGVTGHVASQGSGSASCYGNWVTLNSVPTILCSDACYMAN